MQPLTLFEAEIGIYSKVKRSFFLNVWKKEIMDDVSNKKLVPWSFWHENLL